MPTSAPVEVNHLLTMREAAQRLTISVRTLERLIERHRFPAPVRINTSRRVLLSDVTGYLVKIQEERRAKWAVPHTP